MWLSSAVDRTGVDIGSAFRWYGVERGRKNGDKVVEGWVLAEIYCRRLSGLDDKFVCNFKLVGDVVWEFVNNRPGYLRRNLGGFVWMGTDRLEFKIVQS